MLYTGESAAIALLEVVVHTPPALVPALDMLTLEIPDSSVTELRPEELPSNWTHYPVPTVLSEIGETWVHEAATLALKVPSCVVHSSSNYLLNCRHPDYPQIKILAQEDFRFDSRLAS